MTGEMSREEVTRENYPMHFAIADAFAGSVKPFDQYLGPYILLPDAEKLWIQLHSDNYQLVVFNDGNDEISTPFPPYINLEKLNKAALEAAREVIDKTPYFSEEERDA